MSIRVGTTSGPSGGIRVASTTFAVTAAVAGTSGAGGAGVLPVVRYVARSVVSPTAGIGTGGASTTFSSEFTSEFL